MIRYDPAPKSIGAGEYVGGMETDPDGDYIEYTDHLAALAAIRAAVEAERLAATERQAFYVIWRVAAVTGRGIPPSEKRVEAESAYAAARAALDALLGGGS